ncbi:MAG TPA: tetratricopeptide repeat protein [Opitutaceae bacterium]|nr:tetratricopeptide repeat protein [Opitutaceae bacterium]
MAGRPIVNLSLAVNYAFGGLDPWGYHALNLAIHMLAGLVLFGVVRRTLLRQGYGGQALREHSTFNVQHPTSKSNDPIFQEPNFAEAATWLAFAVALLWVLHPLQTESVTYISQRAESLMGLFYLATLYFFIRGVARSPEPRVQSRETGDNPTSQLSTLSSGLPVRRSFSKGGSSRLWFTASILSCLIGMACKEVMVSAPLMVLLYDRTFVAGTFRDAWSKRWRYYAGLASTWLLLGFLVAGTKGRGSTAGFGSEITSWPYALTQFRAIVHYLQLSLWPHPLVLDYGTALATRASEIVPYAVIVLLLLVGTAFALWRRPALGFLGAWFFAILAPSSSIVPVVTQTMAEHRMYLPLIPVMVLIVLGLQALLGRRSAVILLAMAVGLGCVTARRNESYRSELAIWSDTEKNCPDNMRAHYIVGDQLRLQGKSQEAITELQTAIRLEPRYAQAHNSLANLLEKIPGRLPEAVAEYETAIRLKPDFAEAHYNLALAMADLPGRLPDEISEYEAAVRINPNLVEAHINLAAALSNLPGRMPEAISEYETVVRLEPDLAKAQFQLGVALANSGRTADGIAHLETAIRIQPDDVDAYTALGTALVQAQQYPEAISRFQQALKLQPDNISAYNNLGTALLRVGRFPEAADQFNAVLKIDPRYSTARLNLAVALSHLNRVPEAIQQLKSILQTNANNEAGAAARNLLSQLQSAGDTSAQEN